MDEDRSKFVIKSAPDWVHPISHEDILDLTREEVLSEGEREDIKTYTCYLNRHIVRASNNRTEDYSILIYCLQWPELLQSATVFDYILNKKQRMIFHRLGVLRNGLFIDKLADLSVRVLDNEIASSLGSMSCEKKLHCVVNDLQMGDILVLETSVVTDFRDDDFLDFRYFRYIYAFPKTNWICKNYLFQFIQNRDKDICVKKRYFRNEKGGIVDEKMVFQRGEQYSFRESNFQTPYEPNTFSPFLEIATVASWEDIYKDILDAYSPVFQQNDFKDVEIFLKTISGEEQSEEEKIRKVIEYVQNQIVYIFDAEVMHGHIPQSITETYSKQSGDCKAKSLLLVKLLACLGVDAKLVLVNYDLGFYAMLEMPSPFIFNHVIVKLVYKGSVYFVDPTWSGRSGILEHRAQPFTPYYLEIDGVAQLQQMTLAEQPHYIEEDIVIDIKKGVGTVTVHTIYRFASADGLRTLQREHSILQKVKVENDYQFTRMQYPQDNPVSDYITNAECKVIYDNQKDNEIRELYTATILRPYTISGSARVFKYYYTFDLSNINNIDKDAIIANFVEIPRKVKLSIHSDNFYYRSNPVTRRNLEINNDYFYFSNKKKLSLKTVKVFSEFRPKTYNPISGGDIEKVKKDYAKINDSNFGVGIIYVRSKAVTVGVFVIMVWIVISLIIMYLSAT